MPQENQSLWGLRSGSLSHIFEDSDRTFDREQAAAVQHRQTRFADQEALLSQPGFKMDVTVINGVYSSVEIKFYHKWEDLGCINQRTESLRGGVRTIVTKSYRVSLAIIISVTS